MPSRFGESAFPDLDRLQSQLLTSGLQNKDQPLYQVISQLITFARKLQEALNARIDTTAGTISDATFLTVNNEIASFPSSRQLLAGTGVAFDDSVAHERTINVSGAGLDYVVMSDGNTPIPAPMDDGNGNFMYITYTP
jgi:hypothetical protein